MKRILYLTMAVLMLAACEDFKGEVDQLENRIDRLEETCSQFNHEMKVLGSLVESLQSQNYITSVETVREGDRITAYRINFVKGEPLLLMEGKDGLNGMAPAIGVKEGSDGRYYWTLDGKFVEDAHGNRIVAEGEKGQDAPSPKLRLDGEWWYISYDDGQSWSYLGTASWKASNSIFSKVEVEKRNVKFTLADGSEVSLPICQEIGITLFDEKGGSFDGTDPLLIPVRNTAIVRYELGVEDNRQIRVRVSTSGKYVVSVKHDPMNNNGQISITAPGYDAGEGTVNLIVEDNGYLYSRRIRVGCIVPESVSYTISGMSASTYGTETWTITFVEDLLNEDRVWIDGIIPEMEGIAGFYGTVEKDPDTGAFTKVSMPVGQINSELKPDFVNFPDDGIIRLYGLDDYGSTVEEGSVEFVFTDGGRSFTAPVNGPAVGGISKYGYPVFYNGFFGGSFGDIRGELKR